MITHELLLTRVHYDPHSGIFTRLAGRGIHKAGGVCGFSRPNRYVEIGICGKSFRAHRLAWLYMTGSWPVGEVDHINGVRHDNRWANLRDVSHIENTQNRRAARSGSTSGLIGAHFDRSRGRWTSSINVNGKPVRLGAFPSAQAAHEAYVAAKRRLHPGCAI